MIGQAGHMNVCTITERRGLVDGFHVRLFRRASSGRDGILDSAIGGEFIDIRGVHRSGDVYLQWLWRCSGGQSWRGGRRQDLQGGGLRLAGTEDDPSQGDKPGEREEDVPPVATYQGHEKVRLRCLPAGRDAVRTETADPLFSPA